MKPPVRHVVLFTALGAAFFTTAIVSSGRAYDEEACRIALHVLQEKKRGIVGPIAVLPRSVAEPLSRSEAQKIARYVRGTGPIGAEGEAKLDLLLKSADLYHFSPVEECADIRRWMDASRIVYDEAHIESAKPLAGRYPFAIIGLSMPAVSKGRGEALMTISTTFGPLAGGSDLTWLKKTNDGRWLIEGEVATAIN